MPGARAGEGRWRMVVAEGESEANGVERAGNRDHTAAITFNYFKARHTRQVVNTGPQDR